jgi:two-component system sensor histidine kinase ChvG
VARLLDNAFDAIVGAPSPPPLLLPEPDRLDGWSEAVAARGGGPPRTMLRRAPEGTPFISAAARVPGSTECSF